LIYLKNFVFPKMKKFKEYFFSLKNYILVAILIFSFGFLFGFNWSQIFPEETKLILNKTKEILEPIIKMSSFSQFLFIFLKNSLTLFFVLILGIIFGIYPFLVLFSNGAILGILTFSFSQIFSWSKFFLGTLPHGIIEIPVLILAGAIGLKLGKITFERIFKNKKELKKEIFLALEFFWKILLPLLAIAAAIEVFITAKLLGI